MTIYVLNKFENNPYPKAHEVDTTSNSGVWSGLSPFILDASKYLARRFENLWQFSKVYFDQVDPNGNPSKQWYEWRSRGFANDRAIRYPKGKGTIPLYSYWNEKKLGYIEARKTIYVPIYAELVQNTPSFQRLKWWYEQGFDLVLRDYDGYDYLKLGLTLSDVINNPKRKAGHAFVLAGLLENKLDEMI